MAFHNDRELSILYGQRFGQIAVAKGFVNLNQVQEALAEQLNCNSYSRLRPRKLIGEILFENGWMTLKQIEEVLEEISEGKGNFI